MLLLETGKEREMEGEAARRTYSVAEAGKLLGIGRNQTYDAIKRGEVPAIRIGKRLLVPKAALDRLLSGEAA
jgi:excisionase family DNA binding protein